MYGRGNASILNAITGTTSAAAGATLLPNTGDNIALLTLSVVSTIVGSLVVASFVVARIASSLASK